MWFLLQWDSIFFAFLSLCIKCPPISVGSFPYIVPSVTSQPFTCTIQGNHLDACPIRTLLEVVERAVSCEVTVQISFPHKCGQFNWCSALNVEVVVTFLDISYFHCLHDSIVFLEALLPGVGSYLKYSQGVFAPWDPRSVDRFTLSPWTSYSLVRFWFTHMWHFIHP